LSLAKAQVSRDTEARVLKTATTPTNRMKNIIAVVEAGDPVESKSI